MIIDFEGEIRRFLDQLLRAALGVAEFPNRIRIPAQAILELRELS